MSRGASAAPSDPPWWPWILVPVLAVAIWAYAAGVTLLVTLHLPPRAATPLTWLRYLWWYGQWPPIRSHLIGSAMVAAAPLVALGVALLKPKAEPLHGRARFAYWSEIRRAGLLGKHGIVLGRIGFRYLMLDGQQGVALAAPPRAGKGVGVVIPNALNWPGSLVCVDIKRENWDVTAGYRARAGQPCVLFDPLAQDGRTARWNPLSYVPEDPSLRVSALQQIGEMLYPDPSGGDPFWTASARSLFLGIALYLFETPGKLRTLGEVLRQGMASEVEGFEEHWKRVVEGRQSGSLPLSRVCVQALYDVIRLSPITCSSIRKTFTSRLDLWLNPILDRATAGNDFDLRKLREQAMSIYVAVRPDDLHRLRPVLNLFFQQAIGLQTHELPEQNPKLTVSVLMLLDEFTALGHIPILAESISYLPGYNLRVLLVIQSPSQLREVYGPNNAETMLKSLAARIVFAPKDQADAREISDELGTVTVRRRSRGPSFPFGKAMGGGSDTELRRPLRLPQELKSLSVRRSIVFCEGLPPILCTKIRYFKERAFRARILPPPHVSPLPGTSTAASEDVHVAGGAIAPDDAPAESSEESGSSALEAAIAALRLEDFDTSVTTAAVLSERSEGSDSQALADEFLSTLRIKE